MNKPAFATRAAQPAALWWRVGRHVMRLMNEKNLGLIAAGVAFYAILAIFPGLAATIALWGIVGDPGLALTQLEEFQAVIPSDVYRLLAGQLSKLSTADGLTLGWASIVSFLFAFWSARAGVAAIMRGLDTIYDAPNGAGFSQFFRSLLLTASLIGVLLVAMACIVILPLILAFVPLGPWTGLGVEVVRLVVGFGVLLMGFALIYRLGPNLEGRYPRLISAGAVFASVCWVAASVGFSIYLRNFGTYNEVYGSIGAVIVMLMWLFISAYLVLLGGALNAQLARNAANPIPPATSTP
ncbi:MAG: YihY/virulence factor BrkB family protein [Tateyamaria sp.]|uniref:YihY/virulence factor BrkB family protein n=1 Tax=Tateyamaria sp. TaxID=1929288 RepID=UPI00327FE1E0